MKRTGKRMRRPLALLVVTALCAGILPVGTPAAAKAATSAPAEKSARAGYGLNSPRTDGDGVVTWDCVWFGNYWQEDTNGDGKADKNDAKTPVKWRVLSVDGDDAFLLADKNIDVQRYNKKDTGVTWETSTMRSWLNGYGAEVNQPGEDFSTNNFLNNAFTGAEQRAIRTTNVVNDDNPGYGTEGGNDTSDKVYLLSIDEVTNPAYGFSSDYSKYDEARKAKNTKYVADGGEIKSGYMNSAGSADYWWLRSPGSNSIYASRVDYIGYVSRDGDDVNYDGRAVRAALHINLSSTSSWSYAGTVTSEGGETGTVTPTPVAATGESPESVEKSNITVKVWDYDKILSSEGLEDARISIEGMGEVVTDQSGQAMIANTISEPSAMKRVKVTKDGYRDYILYTTFLNPDLVNTFCTNQIGIPLKKKKDGDDSNPYLSTFMYYNRGKAESTYGRTFDAYETVTFRACGVWNDKEPGYYCLYQAGGKSFESTDGIFQLNMRDSFYKRGGIYIKMVAADGTEVVEEADIRLATMGFGSSAPSDDSEIPLLNAVGESESLVDIPFLENDKISFDLGKFKTVVKRDGKKIRIMLGGSKDLTPDSLKDETWEKWKKFCESQPTDLSLSQWKDVVDGAMDCSWTGAVKMKITGYGWLEGEVGEKELRGGVQVILDGSVGFKQQYMIGVIPVYGEQSFGVKGKVESEASYNMSEKKFSGDNEITVEPYLSIGGGVGVLYAATVGAEGSASMPTKFSWPKGLISSELKGSISLKASVLGFEYEKKLAEATYPLYPGTQKNRQSNMVYQRMNRYLAAPQAASLYSMEAYSLPDETTGEGVWQGEKTSKTARSAADGQREQVLMAGISDLTEPKLVRSGDTTLAFFLTEDAKRSTVQRTKLVYSRYEKSTGTWSEPQAVSEDGTADYLPSVCTANGTTVVSWLNFNSDLTEEATLEEALSGSELCSAVWNEAEGSFETAEKTMASSGKNTYNTVKAVADSGGQLTMAGLKNTDSDIFGLSGENILFMEGEYEDREIRQDITLSEGIPVSYDVSAGADGITAAVCIDTDQDMATLNDREIYLYTSEGEVTRLTSNEGNDSAPHYVEWNGENTLFWYSEDGYRMMGEDGVARAVYESKNANHSEAFTVAAGDNGECAVVWAEADEDNVQQLMAAIYDKARNKWASKVMLTSDETDLSKPSGYFTADGDMEFMYRKKGASGEADSLCVYQMETAPELEIVDAYIKDGTETAGSATTVYVGVKNNGTAAVNSYSIHVGDQTTEGTASLLPGESMVLEADYTVPASLENGAVTISVDVADDSDTTNNSFTLTTGYADLTVAAVEEEYENGKRVQVSVGNTEALDADAMLEVRKGSEQGELVSQHELGTLKQGDIVTMNFSYKKGSDGYEEGTDKLYYVVTTETQEKYKSNNYDFCVLSDEADEPSESPNPAETAAPSASPASPSASVGPTVKPTVKPSVIPTAKPTVKPSVKPTKNPTAKPTKKPGTYPTAEPEESTGLGEEPTTPPLPAETPAVTPAPGASPSTGPDAETTPKPSAVPGGRPTVTPGAAVPPQVLLAPAIAPVSEPPLSQSAKGTGKVSAVRLRQKKQTVTASWKKVSGAAGYQVCYSTSKKWKGRKQKLTRKTKLTIKKLKKNKTYYFRVRAYRMNGTEKVYGEWSKTGKIKIKK